MIRFLPVIIVALLSLLALAENDGGGYGYRRTEADRHPTTMKARRHFETRTRQLFAESHRRYQVSGVRLTMDVRMVAQYGRGAESANAVIPVEVDRIVKLIGQARHRRDDTIRYFSNLRAMERFSPAQIAHAVDTLARLRIIHLFYWGYIGRTERLPQFDRGSLKLTFFAKWNERASSYELNPEIALRIHVMRGIIAELNRPDSGWWPF